MKFYNLHNPHGLPLCCSVSRKGVRYYLDAVVDRLNAGGQERPQPITFAKAVT